MSRIRPRSNATVRRLARRLSWRAGLSLAVLALAGMAALVGALWLTLVSLGDDGPVTVLTITRLMGTGLLVWIGCKVASWLAMPPPKAEGVRVDRAAAPALYRMLDGLAERMDAPPVGCIRISSDMNAAVFQRPSHGYAGRMETTLIIGLPLVHSVSPRQLTAILAHEMAHLARQRCGSRAWGAHLRAWWHRVCERIACEPDWLARLLDRAWAAHAEAELMAAVRLNHLEEFEADRIAARVVGNKLLGDTLVEVAMKANYLETDYWGQVMERASSLSRGRLRPFRDMGMGVAAGFHATPQNRMLQSLVCEEAGLTFHPTLTNRLVALGVAPRMPAPGGITAAELYPRDTLRGVSRMFDRRWWRAVKRIVQEELAGLD